MVENLENKFKKRICDLEKKTSRALEKFAIYSEIIDYENGTIIPPEDITPIDSHSLNLAMEHLIDAGKYANILKEFCLFFNENVKIKDLRMIESSQKIIDQYDILMKRLVENYFK